MAKNKEVKDILIVDDDPMQVKLLQGILTSNGYKVSVATEADDGLDRAINKDPDLVILDVMMPVINGYNFCRLLKHEAEKSEILVILLTSRDEMEDIQIGLEMGADAYLTKPVNTEELLRTIKVVGSMDHKK